MSLKKIMQSYEHLDAAQKRNITPSRPSHVSSSPQHTPNNSFKQDIQKSQNSRKMADVPMGSSPPPGPCKNSYSAKELIGTTLASPLTTSSPLLPHYLENPIFKELPSPKEARPSTTTPEKIPRSSSPAPPHRSASAPANELTSSQRQKRPCLPTGNLHQAERQCVNLMLRFLEDTESHSVFSFFGNFWYASYNGKAEFRTASGKMCTAAKAVEMIESLENEGYSSSWERLAKGWAGILREEGFFGTRPVETGRSRNDGDLEGS